MIVVGFSAPTSVGIENIRALLLLPVQRSQHKSIGSQFGMPQPSSDETLAWRKLCHVCLILFSFLSAVCSLSCLYHGNAFSSRHFGTSSCFSVSLTHLFAWKSCNWPSFKRMDILKFHLQGTYMVSFYLYFFSLATYMIPQNMSNIQFKNKVKSGNYPVSLCSSQSPVWNLLLNFLPIFTAHRMCTVFCLLSHNTSLQIESIL